MTAPFVSQLRTGPEILVLGTDGGPRLHLRVQLADVWDTVRVEAPASEPLINVKLRVLEELGVDPVDQVSYVTKLGGFEILDENLTLQEIGASDGSTLLLAVRRRRPVR